MREMKKVLLEIIDNPRALHLLDWPSAGRLVSYAEGVSAPPHHADDVKFALKPCADADFLEAYCEQMPRVLQGACQGVVKKIDDLCCEKYGNVLELDLTDPVVKKEQDRVEASSTSIERMFGMWDYFQRQYDSSSSFTVHTWLVAKDQNMVDVIMEHWEQDAERTAEAFDAATRLAEKMRARWQARDREDEEQTAEDLEALSNELVEREEEREAVVQKYQQMAEDDDVSAAAVSAELKTLKTAKKQRDYLVDMRASAFSLSFLLLLL